MVTQNIHHKKQITTDYSHIKRFTQLGAYAMPENNMVRSVTRYIGYSILDPWNKYNLIRIGDQEDTYEALCTVDNIIQNKQHAKV